LPHAIVLIGSQGSGKGTLSEFVKLFGFYHAEVGKILRGDQRFKKYTDNGNLCPDSDVKMVIREEIKKAGNSNIIVDGAPRNGAQVGLVCEELSSYNRVFVDLDCNYINCVERIKERAKIAQEQDLVRIDDIDTEVIHRRLNTFVIERDGIFEELKRRKELIVKIDGNKGKTDVRVQFVTEVCPLLFPRVRV
jgi:adenylate kinase family enzyme